jgi:3-hydroxyacyl-[acyl-carrier-protein] dehydratase
MILEAKDIIKLLPHRYPFLYIDRAEYREKGKVKCFKNITNNEPIFQGHFVTNPIFPGVLLIECGAQTAAIMYLMDFLTDGGKDLSEFKMPEATDVAEKVGFLASVKNFNFLKLVLPGDTITINCMEAGAVQNASLIKIMITNQHNKTVATGNLTVTSGGGAKG